MSNSKSGTVKNNFKNSSNAYYTKGLFYEVALEEDKANVLYSLKNEDYQGYPSIHRLYIEMDDPMEYEFAKKYFGGWKHWKMVKGAPWFLDVYKEMRDELEISIQARALNNIRDAAMTDKDRMQANKFLLDKGWADKDDKRGRPNKEAIKKEAQKLSAEQNLIHDDYGRIVSIGRGN